MKKLIERLIRETKAGELVWYKNPDLVRYAEDYNAGFDSFNTETYSGTVILEKILSNQIYFKLIKHNIGLEFYSSNFFAEAIYEETIRKNHEAYQKAEELFSLVRKQIKESEETK